MFGLITLVFILVNIFFVYFLSTIFAEELLNVKNKAESLDKSFHQLRLELDKVTALNIKLENKSQDIFTLYEIAREITRFLKRDELFLFFKGKLRDYMYFDDCCLLDDKKELSDFVDYYKFALLIDKEVIGYLAIKGIPEVDEDKLAILLKQFTLGLRRARLYEKIEDLAISDSLTGAYTRRYCLERLNEEFLRAQKYDLRLSFIMADIDHFKKYNDKYGHLVGDVILRDVAKTIKSCFREIDLLGRFGGEEFVVVLPDTSKNGAVFAAERIRQQVEARKIKAYDESVNVTLSLGVATYPTDAQSNSELIDKSDWALYRAKKSGRNKVCAVGVFE